MSEKFTVTQEEIDELLDSSKTEEQIFAEGKEMCVVYILPSGFTVNGRSAMLDPSHFNLQIGREYCRREASRRLWQLEAYRKQNERYKEKLNELT